jgi:hypothetical protein
VCGRAAGPAVLRLLLLLLLLGVGIAPQRLDERIEVGPTLHRLKVNRRYQCSTVTHVSVVVHWPTGQPTMRARSISDH